MRDQAPQTHAPQRLEYLDAARGLAATTVIFSHFVNSFNMIPPLEFTSSSIFHLWWDGFAAVSFFFVLSGYVLSRKYVQGENAARPLNFALRSYFVTRVFRIYAPFLCILFLSIALQALNAHHGLDIETIPASTGWIQSFWNEPITWHTFKKQADLFTTAAYFKLMPQAWSLQVEIVLSLYLPILLMLVRQGFGWTVFFMTLGTYGFGLMPSFFFFHFILGIYLARTEATTRAWWLRQGFWLKLGFVAAALVLYAGRFSFGWSINNYLTKDSQIWMVTGLGSAMLILAIMHSKTLQKQLSRPVLLFVGRISYSVYLTHMIVLVCLVPLVFKALNTMGVEQLSPSWMAGLLSLLFGTIGLAYLSYTYIEVPCMKLGKRVDSWITGWLRARQERRDAVDFAREATKAKAMSTPKV